MAYDRIDWHSETTDSLDLPEEAGGTHIGMYLAWAITRNLSGPFHEEESAEALSLLKSRKITGCQFLIEQCDTKFWEEDLSPEGNEFSKFYYEQHYFDDYVNTLAQELESEYYIEDTWENFDAIAHVIDQRFAKWKSSKNKQWWEFWK